MLFKDRADAGEQLADLLAKDEEIIRSKQKIIVVSILRGGALVGREIAVRLSAPHFFLVVAKIGAPGNQELAMGAVCGDSYFLDKVFTERLHLSERQIQQQMVQAMRKQKQYEVKFIKNKVTAKNKRVILVDDGVATGASVLAAQRYLQNAGTKHIILAAPVAPADFDFRQFDRVFIIHRPVNFSAVSAFYQKFPQVRDEEIVKLQS